MNETTPENEKLIELATKAGDLVLGWVQTGADSVAQEAPKLVNEIIRLGMVEAIFFCIISIIAGVLLFKIGRISQRKIDGSYDLDKDGHILCMICSNAGAVGAIICLIINLHIFIKIAVAPRFYILQELTKLIN